MAKVQIPNNVVIDRSRYRRTIFTTKEAKAIDLLTSSMREERLAMRHFRKKNQRLGENLVSEAENAEDVIRLSGFLLKGLAIQDNALLEGQLEVGTRQEDATLTKHKQETIEALQTSSFRLGLHRI